jgi:hypothetical protein
MYSVHATDSLGCRGYGEFSLNPKYALDFNVFVSTKPDSCMLGKGKATALVVGGVKPFKFYWESGEQYYLDSSITGLPSGSRYLFVLDSNGCEASRFFTLANQNPLKPLVSSQSSDCSGKLGIIAVSATGGVAHLII